MLPHVRDRPLALQAFPAGHRAARASSSSRSRAHFPDWIARVEVAKAGGTIVQVLANDAATLVYLAGQNVVTPHIWLSRADRPQQPDRLIFDFDPSPRRDVRRRARRGARAGRAAARRRPGDRTRWSPARAASTSSARCAAAATSATVHAYARARRRGAGGRRPRAPHAASGARATAARASTSTSTASTTPSTRSRPTACAPARRAGGDADPLGGARRPRARPAGLDDHDGARPAGGAGGDPWAAIAGHARALGAVRRALGP